MSGKFKSGFTFIELMVVILILGLMATIVIPNLARRLPGYQRDAFINELNTLAAFSWQNALVTQKTHRLFFDLKKQIVRTEIEQLDPKENSIKYVPLSQAYRSTSYTWPDVIELKNFFVEGTDELNKPGQETTTIWFYIVPDGFSQEVVINFLDTSQTPPVQLGLVLNPFTAQFKEYETFQKP